MMSKVSEYYTEFRYFTNGKTLFELVENYFPYSKHVAKFLKIYKAVYKQQQVRTELEKLQVKKQPIYSAYRFGYLHQYDCEDVSVAQLNHELKFLIDKEHAKGLYCLLTLDKKQIKEDQLRRNVEKYTLQKLAEGVNDAKFELFLNELLAETKTVANNNKSIPNLNYAHRPSHKSIALMYRILNETNEATQEYLNEGNKNNIASKFGWTSKTSGDKILRYYNDFATKQQRLRLNNTRKEKTDRIKTFKETLELLYSSKSSYPISIKKLEEELITISNK